MKVLLITSQLSEKNGWGRYSIQLVKGFAQEGFEVTVLCVKKNKYFDDRGVNQVAILPDALRLKQAQFLAPLIALRLFFLRKNKFDVIHCVVEPYSFLTFLLSKIFDTRYFITIHGSYGIKGFQSKVYKLLQSLAYKNAHKIICVSNYTKQRVLEEIKLSNLVVILNCVQEKFLTRKETYQKRKENILLSVGALKKRKGIDLVLKAMPIIKKLFPDIKYIIVGDQSDKNYFSYLTSLTRELRIADSVIFLNNINDGDLSKLYDKAKVFVLTPVSDKYNFEGFGLVYLEANAKGVPVIGSYGNGGEDAIQHEYSGFLVKTNSSEIADAVLKILKNEDSYISLCKSAQEWASRFTCDKLIESYKDQYNLS